MFSRIGDRIYEYKFNVSQLLNELKRFALTKSD